MKKIIIRSIIIGLCLVLIEFIDGAPQYLMTLFVPPRVFILLGIIIIFVLLKILYELKNKGD